jgi:hypothetical protein
MSRSTYYDVDDVLAEEEVAILTRALPPARVTRAPRPPAAQKIKSVFAVDGVGLGGLDPRGDGPDVRARARAALLRCTAAYATRVGHGADLTAHARPRS